MSPLLLAPVFFALAFIFSMLGLGGGVVYVPLLVLAGLTVKEASVVSLFAITLTSASAFTTYLKGGRFDWKLAAVVDPPTDVMAFVGGFYANLLAESFLNAVLLAAISLAGVLMIKKVKPRQGTVRRGPFTWVRTFKGEVYAVNVPLMSMFTGAVGFFVGMVGITGGVFKVPAMVLVCGVPVDIAVGTSSGMVLLTALSALLGHLATIGYVDWPLVVSLGLACLLGGALGAKVALKARRETLSKAYGVFMFTLAILIAVKSLLWP